MTFCAGDHWLGDRAVNIASDTPSGRHSAATQRGTFWRVHMWLADQAQSSVQVWLTSPWVAFIGLVASLIAVVQALIASTKWFIAKTDKASSRRRLARCSVVGIVASTVVLAPLTWQMVAVTEAEAQGNQLWMGEVFSLMIFGTLIIPAHLYLRVDFSFRVSAAYSVFGLVLICLGGPTALYDYYTSSGWERLLVSATPVLTLAILTVTYLAHVIPRAKAHGGDRQKPPASAHWSRST